MVIDGPTLHLTDSSCIRISEWGCLATISKRGSCGETLLPLWNLIAFQFPNVTTELLLGYFIVLQTGKGVVGVLVTTRCCHHRHHLCLPPS